MLSLYAPPLRSVQSVPLLPGGVRAGFVVGPAPRAGDHLPRLVQPGLAGTVPALISKGFCLYPP